MSVLLFQFVDSLEITVEVVSNIIPRVTRIVDILVCPSIRKDDFARVRPQISECIEDVAECIMSLKM